MPLGQPAVLTPRALDLRSVQMTITAIRERLQFIEAAVQASSSQAGANATAASSLVALATQLQTLTQRVTRLEAFALGADTISLVTDTDVTKGEAVHITGLNRGAAVDTASPLGIHATVGLASTGGAAGQSIEVLRRGSLTNVATGLTVGRAVYAIAGGLTQAPSAEDVAISVGVATSATDVWVDMGEPVLRTLGVDLGFEEFLPASVGLVGDAVRLLQSFNAQANGIVIKTGVNTVVTLPTASEGAANITLEGVRLSAVADIDGGIAGVALADVMLIADAVLV